MRIAEGEVSKANAELKDVEGSERKLKAELAKYEKSYKKTYR